MSHNAIDLSKYAANKSIVERFYKYIQFCEHGKSCQACHWLYKPSRDTQDYGRFYVCYLSLYPRKKLSVRPSRFMWTIERGHTDKLILHTCDIPACVNIYHLFCGSQKENAQDREHKLRGKQAKGEEHYSAKVAREVIPHMRALREYGLTYKDIGQIFGVTGENVSLILRGLSWKHLNNIGE